MEQQTVQREFVHLTEAARAQVARLVGQEEEGVGLRLAVVGGGCSGFSYNLEFTRQKPGDNVQETEEGVPVFIDSKSLLYLKGTELDFEGGLSGKGFAFRNPNASNTCGCGESFSV